MVTPPGMFIVDPGFERWAKLPSGCDGGNLKSMIWLCAIEWGGYEDPADVDFEARIRALEREFPSRTPLMHKTILCNQRNKYPLDLCVYKLVTTILTDRRLTRDNWRLQYKNYAGTHITYASDSQFCKLNLYPISFRNTTGDYWVGWAERIGIPTKEECRSWCRTHRLPMFASWVAEHSPKLILCLGTTYVDDYFLAFGGETTQQPQTERVGDRALSWSMINGDKTLLAITPHSANQYGLNSFDRISNIGLRIKEICNEHFGRDWMPESLKVTP